MNVINIIIISSSEKRFETTENNATLRFQKYIKIRFVWTRKLSITRISFEFLYLRKDRRRNRQVKAGRWNNARKSTLLNPIYHFASCSISVEQKGREKIRARSKRGIRGGVHEADTCVPLSVSVSKERASRKTTAREKRRKKRKRNKNKRRRRKKRGHREQQQGGARGGGRGGGEGGGRTRREFRRVLAGWAHVRSLSELIYMSTPQTYPTKPRTRLEPRGTIVLFVFINRVPVSLWSSEKRTEREREKKRKDSFFIFVLSTHRSLCNPWLQRELFRLTWNTEKRRKNSLMERILLSSFERIHPLTITEIFISSRNELWKCNNNCSKKRRRGDVFHSDDFLASFLRLSWGERLKGEVEEKGREGLISAASGRSENAFRHRGRRVTSAYREQVERRCGSFSRHRGQPRPARRGQQREVEVRFGALGVARTMSRVESSRGESTHGDVETRSRKSTLSELPIGN